MRTDYGINPAVGYSYPETSATAKTFFLLPSTITCEALHLHLTPYHFNSLPSSVTRMPHQNHNRKTHRIHSPLHLQALMLIPLPLRKTLTSKLKCFPQPSQRMNLDDQHAVERHHPDTGSKPPTCLLKNMTILHTARPCRDMRLQPGDRLAARNLNHYSNTTSAPLSKRPLAQIFWAVCGDCPGKEMSTIVSCNTKLDG